MRKISFPALAVALALLWIAPQTSPAADPADLTRADARQALAIANQWRWTHPEIKSFVTPREVVFKFPDGRLVKIPLPEDKMMVAVAPYINQTHT